MRIVYKEIEGKINVLAEVLVKRGVFQQEYALMWFSTKPIRRGVGWPTNKKIPKTRKIIKNRILYLLIIRK